MLVPLLQAMVVRQQSLCDLGYTFSFGLAVHLKNRTGPQQPGFYWAFDLFIRECGWGGKTASWRGAGWGAILDWQDNPSRGYEMQFLRLRLPRKARQTSLRMTALFVLRFLGTGP